MNDFLKECIWIPKGIDLSKRELTEQAIANVDAFFKGYKEENDASIGAVGQTREMDQTYNCY